MYTYIYAYLPLCRHTYMNTCMHGYLHSYSHTDIHTWIPTRIYDIYGFHEFAMKSMGRLPCRCLSWKTPAQSAVSHMRLRNPAMDDLADTRIIRACYTLKLPHPSVPFAIALNPLETCGSEARGYLEVCLMLHISPMIIFFEWLKNAFENAQRKTT